MFKPIIEAIMECEERHERLQEVRLQKQDKQLKARQIMARILRNTMLMAMPATETQAAGLSMCGMHPPPPTYPLHPIHACATYYI